MQDDLAKSAPARVVAAMGTEIVVKLAPEATLPDSSARRAINACTASLGVSLQPLHPSTSDPDLSTYLVGWVDPIAVEGVLDQLRRCNGVEGAYAKPPAEPSERM